VIGNLTIRADSSSNIGTGHVMRMIALGQAWKELGGTTQFVGLQSPLDNRLKAEGFSLQPVLNAHPQPEDLRDLLSITSKEDWIVIDGYHFDASYQFGIREAGRKALVLDDICNRDEYNADILLNQNPDAHNYSYDVNDDVTFLLGSRYALIRQEFLSFHPQHTTIQPTASKILVTLGGADPTNITSIVLSAIQSIKHDHLHLKIIVGASNQHHKELEQLTNSLSCDCEILTAVNNMPELMDWADIAISAAGSTCWELCFLGVPFIAIQIADNQQGIIKELSRSKTAICIASPAETLNIANELKSLILNQDMRQTMSDKGRSLIDGKGAKRVAQKIYTAGLKLRRANMNDSKMLLDWRNDPQIRANSFNSNKITLEEHCAWFERKLMDKHCIFWIAEDSNHEPVGQIRFDREDDKAVISVSVAPSMMNMGIGTAMTRLGCVNLGKQWTKIQAVALVKKDNPASAVMFQHAGFTLDTTPTDDHLQFTWSDNEHVE